MSDDFSTRERRLLEQLVASPVVDVLGVVAARGASGSRADTDPRWMLHFSLDAWRVAGGELQTGPLSVRQMMTEKELDRLRALINPYAVVRIRAQVGESAFGGHQALLETFVGPDASDAELNRHAQRLQEPVTFEDPTFGTFTLDRQVDWFAAEVVWDGRPVNLHLSDSDEVPGALRTAHALWRDQRAWNRRVRDYAVRELLPLKNDAWLDEDEAELTPEEFLRRMTLESITVHADGSFEFWHDDGDLFAGHAIHISGNLNDGPTDADTPG